MSTTARPAIKICVPVDRHIYGSRRSIPFPSAGLMQKADVVDIRVPEYLNGVSDLKNTRPIRGDERLSDADITKVREISESGKPIIYHHGGGFVEERIVFERDGEELGERGLPAFINDGCLQSLQDLNIAFSSFHLGNTRKAKVIISNDWEHAVWKTDDSPGSVIADSNEWINIFANSLESPEEVYKGMIGFENSPWKMRDGQLGQLSYRCETGFLNRVFETFPSIYFHLDIAHAKVTAWNLYPKFRNHDDPVETAKWYMGELPLDRVKAVHISGTKLKGDVMHEPHIAPQLDKDEEDYVLLRWLLPQAPQLEYIESEDYESGEDILAEQMQRLRAIIDMRRDD